MIRSEYLYDKNNSIIELSNSCINRNDIMNVAEGERIEDKIKSFRDKLQSSVSEEIYDMIDDFTDLYDEQTAFYSKFFYEQGFKEALNLAMYVSHK